MGLGLFRGNKLGYGLACSDHLAFHGEKTGTFFLCWFCYSPLWLLLTINYCLIFIDSPISLQIFDPGVCGSVVSPREMTLPSPSLTGFTLSTDDNHKDKQDVGFSLAYRWEPFWNAFPFINSLCRMLKGDECKGLQFYRYPNLPASRA